MIRVIPFMITKDELIGILYSKGPFIQAYKNDRLWLGYKHCTDLEEVYNTEQNLYRQRKNVEENKAEKAIISFLEQKGILGQHNLTKEIPFFVNSREIWDKWKKTFSDVRKCVITDLNLLDIGWCCESNGGIHQRPSQIKKDITKINYIQEDYQVEVISIYDFHLNQDILVKDYNKNLPQGVPQVDARYNDLKVKEYLLETVREAERNPQDLYGILQPEYDRGWLKYLERSSEVEFIQKHQDLGKEKLLKKIESSRFAESGKKLMRDALPLISL